MNQVKLIQSYLPEERPNDTWQRGHYLMPSSSPLTFFSAKLVKYEPHEGKQPTMLVFEIPNSEKNRVHLQTLANMKELATKLFVAVTLTVPDRYATPDETE